MLAFYLNATIALALLVALASALVALAFSRPSREELIVLRRRRVPLHPARRMSARRSVVRHRRAA
jgi:hypothetical protein